jgi:hypothetical protein
MIFKMLRSSVAFGERYCNGENGCSRIDFGCNCVVVLQPCLCFLHLVVTIAMGLLGCDSYMLIATRTLIVVAKVVLNCNAILGL